ncbi:COX191 [Auxenochlorella protothecoides x Auxenochlorella symbiontica]
MSKSCQGLFVEFVKCLRESDCMKVEHRSVTECAKVSEECAGLRYTFFRCKHGQIDPRTRIKGNKGY